MLRLSGSRRRYTGEQREEALALAERLGSVAAAARRLRLPAHTLYRWRASAGARPATVTLERVRVLPAPSDGNDAVTVHGPAGLRVEGLALEQVAGLWRLLA